MVGMAKLLAVPQNLPTDAWVAATWADYLEVLQHLDLPESRAYFDAGWLRIETMPIGFAHGRDNSLLAAIVSLYCTCKDLPFLTVTNGSFRKAGERECQPDLAFYIGNNLPEIPRSNQAVDITLYPSPTLAVEVASTTLSDDLGQKRLLYERIGVSEYWVVNVEASQVIAFAISAGGSRQIQTSLVLPGLEMTVVDQVLRNGQTQDDRVINRWLLQQFMAET
jgi:Uma2 family endonuclease